MPYTSEWIDCTIAKCHKCNGPNVQNRSWESDDGGHEDWQFRCLDCEHTWWIEGIDS